MKITNQKIFQLANNLLSVWNNLDIYIPAKANFFIQKNIKALAAAAQEIDKARLEVAKHYGKENEQGTGYIFPAETLKIANQELKELFEVEQELEIKTFSIEDLGNTELTPAQMQAIIFMIED